MCGTGDLFADILPLDGEATEELRRRRVEMEAALQYLRDVQPDRVDTAATEVWPLRPTPVAVPSFSQSGWSHLPTFP
jgi:hypothetical protein